MQIADVVIIGSGVIGASIAYHLTQKGVRNIIVLERNSLPGLESTSRATGGFRAQFASAINVQLSLLSRRKFKEFPEVFASEPVYLPHGYLFIASNTIELEALKAAQRIQKSEGLHESELLQVPDIASLNPAISLKDVMGGSYCPTDGFIKPVEILDHYLKAAIESGVRVEYGAEVTGMKVKNRRIHEVQTTSGTIAAETVVNAAGPWAGMIGKSAGIEIPVTPLRRQVASTGPSAILPENMPMTIFLKDGFHLRVRDGRVLLLKPGIPSADPFDVSVSESWIDEVHHIASDRVPCLRNVPVIKDRCWGGLYEMSPDKHVILGRSETVENFYLANGSSGHGIMHSPAIGLLLAEEIVNGKATTVDISPLSPSRFSKGKLLPSSDLL